VTRVPGKREVNSALSALKGAIRRSLDDLNGQAGRALAKGRYEDAEIAVQLGARLPNFFPRSTVSVETGLG
jgi:hypothetical protein